MKIAIIGARGSLGAAAVKYWNSSLVRGKCTLGASAADDEIVPFDLPEFDVTARRFVLDMLGDAAPDVIVNAAGLNFVDWLESHPNTARTVHAQGTAFLRTAAQRLGALLVQISCGEVFSSESSEDTHRLWTELDAPNPLSVYAQTKLDAERAASECERHLIVRTSALFGPVGEQSAGNFVDTILKSCRRTRRLHLVDDLRFSPTFSLDFLRGLYFLIHAGQTGLFHVVNSGTATTFEAARHLLVLSGLDRHETVGISAKEYGYTAPRTRCGALAANRYNALPERHVLPDWQTAMAEYLHLRQESASK